MIYTKDKFIEEINEIQKKIAQGNSKNNNNLKNGNVFWRIFNFIRLRPLMIISLIFFLILFTISIFKISQNMIGADGRILLATFNSQNTFSLKNIIHYVKNDLSRVKLAVISAICVYFIVKFAAKTKAKTTFYKYYRKSNNKDIKNLRQFLRLLIILIVFFCLIYKVKLITKLDSINSVGLNFALIMYLQLIVGYIIALYPIAKNKKIINLLNKKFIYVQLALYFLVNILMASIITLLEQRTGLSEPTVTILSVIIAIAGVIPTLFMLKRHEDLIKFLTINDEDITVKANFDTLSQLDNDSILLPLITKEDIFGLENCMENSRIFRFEFALDKHSKIIGYKSPYLLLREHTVSGDSFSMICPAEKYWKGKWGSFDFIVEHSDLGDKYYITYTLTFKLELVCGEILVTSKSAYIKKISKKKSRSMDKNKIQKSDLKKWHIMKLYSLILLSNGTPDDRALIKKGERLKLNVESNCLDFTQIEADINSYKKEVEEYMNIAKKIVTQEKNERVLELNKSNNDQRNCIFLDQELGSGKTLTTVSDLTGRGYKVARISFYEEPVDSDRVFKIYKKVKTASQSKSPVFGVLATSIQILSAISKNLIIVLYIFSISTGMYLIINNLLQTLLVEVNKVVINMEKHQVFLTMMKEQTSLLKIIDGLFGGVSVYLITLFTCIVFIPEILKVVHKSTTIYSDFYLQLTCSLLESKSVVLLVEDIDRINNIDDIHEILSLISNYNFMLRSLGCSKCLIVLSADHKRLNNILQEHVYNERENEYTYSKYAEKIFYKKVTYSRNIVFEYMDELVSLTNSIFSDNISYQKEVVEKLERRFFYLENDKQHIVSFREVSTIYNELINDVKNVSNE